MSNVTELDERRPHITGNAKCSKCSHEWVAVVPETEDFDTLTCPSCEMHFGAFTGPLRPSTVFMCYCGGTLFYLSPDGHVCHSCGKESFSWNEAIEE